MQKPSFAESVDKILIKDGRYDRDSYYFVREGLDYTLKVPKKHGDRQTPRHVSGQELLDGLRRYAIHQFGPMAKTVLVHWGIRQCGDFGEIVFNMVEKGILGKTEQDSREDFKDGYDFDEVFVKPYQPLVRHTGSRHMNAHANSDRFRDKNRSAGSEKLSSGSN
jgi:uncharacterized repeat protein (TIGR04138 family)